MLYLKDDLNYKEGCTILSFVHCFLLYKYLYYFICEHVMYSVGLADSVECGIVGIRT